MAANPIMEIMHPIIRTFLIPILFVSNGPMILKTIINNPPGRSTEAEKIAEQFKAVGTTVEIK